MITSEFFSLIKYHNTGKKTSGVEIASLWGIDSETYNNGQPFLICISDGKKESNVFTPENILISLLDNYTNIDFTAWNLKFDSGSILYNIPDGFCNTLDYPEEPDKWIFQPGKVELWIKGKTKIYLQGREITLEYIPHKFLKISESKSRFVRIWDICQFYSSGLDKAAKKYLNEKKEYIETKTFTVQYVEKHLPKITSYCIHDAYLTARLSNLFLEKLSGFGIRATSLYSSASLSFRYFQDRGTIIHIKRYWKNYKDAVRIAIDSYQGGKFEITARGYFNSGYVYDIVSAYPYELYNLVDISFARVHFSNQYEPEAIYGFIRIHIKIYDDISLPFGLLIHNTRVYAIGEYYITVTKNELDYIRELNINHDIISAVWLFIDRKNYPYRDTIKELFALKNKYKSGDPMYYMLAKIMMNGFYGKAIQCIKHWKGHYMAGQGFNPFYAAIITANTRLRVCRLQNEYKAACIAVHTDSVTLTKKLPDNILSSKLGGMELQKQGEGVIVACGCYQIGNSGAFKGFEPVKIGENPDGSYIYENWFDILNNNRNKSKIPYSAIRVEGFIEAVSKGHFNTINLFQKMPKEINLNADIKRIWEKDNMRGRDYLKKLWYSSPCIVKNNTIPEYWK